MTATTTLITSEDRVENIRRVSELAKLMADSGTIVITALISPYRIDRRRAREIALEGNAEFIECLWMPRWKFVKRGIQRISTKRRRPARFAISPALAPPHTKRQRTQRSSCTRTSKPSM